MTSEEILTIYKILQNESLKAYNDHQTLINSVKNDRPFPDLELKESLDNVKRTSSAFESFKTHEWS